MADDEQQQAAATSAFLAAMQHSHQQMQQQQRQQDPSQPYPPLTMPSSTIPAVRQRESDHSAKGNNGSASASSSNIKSEQSASTSASSPPKKAAKKSAGSSAKDSHATSTYQPSGDPPTGPPYICPTCQTSYSRLEYLRRHERRHQDIRPFVCECGKGFSRSDVLSRHKRQCHFHLTGEQPSAEAAEAASKKTRRQSSTKDGKASRKKAGGATAAASSTTGKANKNSAGSSPEGGHSPPSQPGTSLMNQSGIYSAATQPGVPPPLLPHGTGGGQGSMGLGPPPPPVFYHPSTGQPTSDQQHGPLMPPSSSGNSDYARTSGFMSVISHALSGGYHPGSSFHNNPGGYPASPESNASINSRNSSPRLPYRDALPYAQRSGSVGNSRQSSLRKGTLDPYHAPPPWESAINPESGGRSSPAPPGGSQPNSRPSSTYGGASTRTGTGAGGGQGAGVGAGVGLPGFPGGIGGSAPAFSYPANEFANPSAGNSNTGVNTAGSQNPMLSYSQNAAADAAQQASQSSANANRSSGTSQSSTNNNDASRFNLSTGPLSPFSGMAMSPYLSAFSNARDTPLVASPGRGAGPGTPTSSLNANPFDAMRPPPPKTSSGVQTPGRTGSFSSASGPPAMTATSLPTTTSASTSQYGTAEAGSQKALPLHFTSQPLRRKESLQQDGPTTPSASVPMSESGSLPALTDFIDDQQRSAANGLLTLLGGGGAETPSRFVRGDEGSGSAKLAHRAIGSNQQSSSSNKDDEGNPSSSSDAAAAAANSRINNNPGTNSANPSSNPFFDQAVTAGPENAFLLRLQGGEPSFKRTGSFQHSAHLLNGHGNGGGNNSDLNHPGLRVNGAGANGNGSGSGMYTPGFGQLGAPWDFTGATPGGQSGGVGWLLSPSIQALISSFASGTTPQAGDGGSYFPSSRRGSLFPLSSPVGSVNSASGDHSTATSKDGPLAESNDTSIPATIDDPELHKLGFAGLEKALEDVNNPFYIPKTMFQPCCNPAIASRWQLPSLTRMSMLAMHSQMNLLKHVPILHEPTFRLNTTPRCLAFVACLLGSHEVGRRWWVGEEVVPSPQGHQKALTNGQDQSSTYDDGGHPLVDEIDGGELVKPIAVSEKMDMLMRSFATQCQAEKDKVTVVQSLMLFQTNNFLSSDPTTRAIASVSHGSIVPLARRAGFYDPKGKHVSRSIEYSPKQVVQSVQAEAETLHYGFSFLASYLPNFLDEEKVWRQWCEYEGRRRTAYLLFIMDTVASLDAGGPTLIELDELVHLPLPAPDTIWRASDPKSFRDALEKDSGLSFFHAIKELLRPAEEGEDEESNAADGIKAEAAPQSSQSSTGPLSMLNGPLGPFARLVILLPILRAILHVLQQRRSVDRAANVKPSPLELWLTANRSTAAKRKRSSRSHSANKGDRTSSSPLRPKDEGAVDDTEGGLIQSSAQDDDGEIEGDDWHLEMFKRALSRWRKAWDDDPLCIHASSPVKSSKVEQDSAEQQGQDATGKPSTTNGTALPDDLPRPLFTSKTASGATPICEDALPFYWLSHVLLGHATNSAMPVRSRSNTGTTTTAKSNGSNSATPTAATSREGSRTGSEGGVKEEGTSKEQAQANDDGVNTPDLPKMNGATDHKRQSSSSSSAKAPTKPTASDGAMQPLMATTTNLRVPDFRSMLKFAKAFVQSGEGAHGKGTGRGSSSSTMIASQFSANDKEEEKKC